MLKAIIENLVGRDYQMIATEADLQSQVEQRLRRAGIEFKSQVQLDTIRDRIDLLTACGCGIELKIKGGATAVLAQLERYAQCDRVESLLLVTTKAAHLKLSGVSFIHGKAIYVIQVGAF